MPNIDVTNIPSARVPVIDPSTGVASREWYRYFYNLFQLVGAGGNPTSLEDVQLGPPQMSDFFNNSSDSDIGSLNPSSYPQLLQQNDFETAPSIQLGTIASYNLETGLWIPELSSDATPPTLTYSQQFGSYTKIGSSVWITCNITANITVAGTGNPTVTGFPFSANSNCANGPSFGITDLLATIGPSNYINSNILIMNSSIYNVANASLSFGIQYEI